MALSRRTGARFQANIWPGFVDAMTGLLLVLMFVLTIFMVIQSMLSDTISGQESQLDTLSSDLADLSQALGLQQRRNREMTGRIGELETTLSDAQTRMSEQLGLIAQLTATRDQQAAQLDEAQNRISGFEERVAALLAQQTQAQGEIASLAADRDRLGSERDALETALAAARSETDAAAEAARLAAARREALEALAEDLRAQNAGKEAQIGTLSGQVDALQQALSEEEAQRLADAEAAAALRNRLENADTELTAMTLALEEQRKRAEDTLTLLAAARSARDTLEDQLQTAQSQAQTSETLRERLSEAEKRAALLSVARDQLSQTEARASEAERQTELLNQQAAALRNQLGQLQALLDDARSRDDASQVQLQNLGQDLNAALARVASEERRRRQLEEAERKRLEEQAKDLEAYRSEFFGKLRGVLGNQEGIRIEGDRFVFSSEVLFDPGAAELSSAGTQEIAKIASILRGVMNDIPAGIDWILRVDGHTDNLPLSGTGRYADNWELSQARALSVVRYLVDYLGFPPDRLAANGFGQYQPVDPADTVDARAQNRRIELKLTER
ncbi:peptidoglycan -binding protein [Salipiger sp. 1_MG-2023]|uniref:peptidoglycan -binding protein n=1 Tax=Salipiger sp. 1_MG-2023 TaxID=3062665 RepID=UPI0026E4688E|nr:peptidoglycan -binding protein [Salipiger sp. 1_MG-2023]MDO6585982.1 peptidoglycan -binding protein [Salipiger sp. 1_MG-2023]